MRKKHQKQMPLMRNRIDHPRAKELEAISRILDENSIICDWVWQDLSQSEADHGPGAQGMSAEQVLRAAIIKQMEEFSYEELAFHLLDSVCYRNFCRIGIADKGFGKSALCRNIRAISERTLCRPSTGSWSPMARIEALKKGSNPGSTALWFVPISMSPGTPVCCGTVFGS